MELVPAGAKLKTFELTVWMPGKGALRDVFRGLSLNHALQVARNRYPKALVEVPSIEAQKPRLPRSHMGPREMENRRLRLAKKNQND